MIVRTRDVELRILGEEDTRQVVHVIRKNLPHLMEYLDFMDRVEYDNQLAAIRKWKRQYLSGEGFEAGIFLEGEFVGMCGMRINTNDNRAEIGYWLSEEHVGKGIVTGVVKELLALGFETYMLHKITILTVDTNRKSQGIPKRLGFRYDGILREHQLLHGEYRDLYIFSMVDREWRVLYRDE